MWNLAVYLPLVIGDLVSESDEEWECFLLLLEILKICVSSVFSDDLVEYLAFLIEMSFCKCYPHKNILPKQHYLLHFPSQILKLVFIKSEYLTLLWLLGIKIDKP